MAGYDKDFSIETAASIEDMMEIYGSEEGNYAVLADRGAGVTRVGCTSGAFAGAVFTDGFTPDVAVPNKPMTITLKQTICMAHYKFHISYVRWGFICSDGTNNATINFQMMYNTNSPYYGSVVKMYMAGTDSTSVDWWGYEDISYVSSPFHTTASAWTYEKPGSDYRWWLEVTIELTILVDSTSTNVQIKPKVTIYNRLDGETYLYDDIDAISGSDYITTLWAGGNEIKAFAYCRNNSTYIADVYWRRLSMS
jgi:hypothetical protein